MILSEDQKALLEAARRFSRERLLPTYMQREREGRMDRALLREMGELGLLGVDVAPEFGGMGVDGVTTGLIVEELAYGDFNVSAVVLVMSLCATVIARNASPKVAAQWLPRVPRGDAILALSITEPKCGSDAGALQLKARRDGDFYVLDGEKTSTTYCDSADAFVVFARTGTPEQGARGVTAFLVPSDMPGIQTTTFKDVGSRMSSRGSVFFDSVKIPLDHRLGDEGKGFSQVMAGFDYSRALIALQCLGAAQASLDEAWAYTKEREAFGGPIARFQGVSFPLVEGETLVAAARQLSYHALSLRDAGEPHTVEAAMVKWMGPKTAFDVIHQCLLTFGHYGWSMDLAHQQRMRDVMGLEIGDGTAGVMKLIVARARAGRAATAERNLENA
ncbi:MAG: cyclohexanecarboxyl-CoA dehydrogenase [Hydrocarboniphaga sp.]|uniref:acyl-CoA dehydrogenase family protein n=1 Tax=Hydrocarboniphaga sp. TaxID=2033016 RepID=UPI00260B708E|nr:acyl-CoA dehydrogenase family protein [Hydrocarboniphaga sp.]MDB5971890.1 cyclohexanecarboxyl-CoA dehydrogenase [Hydrocarboniphaga sp.]